MRFLLALLIAFPCLAQVGLRSPAYVGQLQRPAPAGGGASCLETYKAGVDGGVFAAFNSFDRHYYGVTFSTNADVTLCAVAFKLDIVGDVSGKTFTAYVYSQTGDDLDTIISTGEAKSGANLTSGTTNVWSFATPVAIAASVVRAIVIKSGVDDASNYLNIYYGASDTIPGYRHLWFGPGLDKANAYKDTGFDTGILFFQ